MATKIGRRSTLHDFRTEKGDIIKYDVLIAVTGLSQGAIQNRLKCFDEIPTDTRRFVKLANEFPTMKDFEAAVSGAEHVSEIKDTRSARVKLEELKILIDEEKLREIKFKNEKTEGKHVLLSDVQLELDNFLIALKTNLEGLPAQVAQAVMVCREEHEAVDIILEALRHLTRGWSKNPIKIGVDNETPTN